MKTITIASQKGGVGKTTTSVTLAHGLALKGKQVLLIDLDPQGQCATALDLAHEDGVYTWLVMQRPLIEVARIARPNLTLIPGDKQTATVQMLWQLQEKKIDALKGELKPMVKLGKLDYVIFDTSPSVGGLQERALWAADYVIIPVKMDYLSADAVSRTIDTMYRGIDPQIAEQVRSLADGLGVPVGEVAQALLGYALEALNEGKLTLNPRPRSGRFTLFGGSRE